MTLTELMESSRQFPGLPPVDLIRQAYRELPLSGDGEIVKRIEIGVLGDGGDGSGRLMTSISGPAGSTRRRIRTPSTSASRSRSIDGSSKTT